jgi:hypothetical protein
MFTPRCRASNTTLPQKIRNPPFGDFALSACLSVASLNLEGCVAPQSTFQQSSTKAEVITRMDGYL